MNIEFNEDYEFKTGKKYKRMISFLSIFKYHDLKYLYYFRKSREDSLLKSWYMYKTKKIGLRYGIEMDCNMEIGKKLKLEHAFNITVNNKTKLGDRIVIFKGVTIGSIRSGKKAGVPTIGNDVVLCTNCFICGNIKIGNNVLIAANAFVNFDVPNNSIVIGNPGKIHTSANPVKDYIKNYRENCNINK